MRFKDPTRWPELEQQLALGHAYSMVFIAKETELLDRELHIWEVLYHQWTTRMSWLETVIIYSNPSAAKIYSNLYNCIEISAKLKFIQKLHL